MPDYPDWQQIFRLVGSDITINVNIEASAATLPVSIDAATVALDVTIAAAEVALDIVFTDQSIAVFDANQWYALQAQQVAVQGTANINAGSTGYPASRTVPTGKTFFITGIGGAVFASVDSTIMVQLVIAGVFGVIIGGQRGTGIAFDTPMRATEGQLVQVALSQQSAAQQSCYASMWGYDRSD